MDARDTDARFESFLDALAATPPPYQPPDLGAGHVFAHRYTVERELGRGGMGTVFLARDDRLGRNVALKVARGRVAAVELARLRHEATVMAKLSHPGIVTVFEADVFEDHVYIALEFVPGGTVRDWLDAGERGWREVVTMFGTIAEALAAAHAAGVVHRDFKPHNVLLDLQGRPRVADFGLAHQRSESTTRELPSLESGAVTQPGSIVGTPAYMAPEQATGDGATEASDQFSFFVSLYEALSGVRPFEGRTLEALLLSIESGPPARIPGVPRPLASLVQRGLHADPTRRHPDMASVCEALRRILHARRRRTWIAGLVLASVTTAAVGVTAASSSQRPCQRDEIDSAVPALWSVEVEANVRDAVGPALVGHMDRYRDALVDARVGACERHRVSQTLSDTDFSLRSACLARLEGRLVGLRDDIETHGAPPVPVDDLLASPTSCSDVRALRMLHNRFDGRSQRESALEDAAYRTASRWGTIARLRSRRGFDTSEALTEMESLGGQHGFMDVLAYARILRSTETPDVRQRSALLDEAQEFATKSQSAQVLMEVALHRAELALAEQEHALALAFLDHAASMVRLHATAAGRAHDEQRIGISRQKAEIAAGRASDAVKALERMLETIDAHEPEALEVAMLRADALAELGRLDAAIEAYSAALSHPLADDPSQRFGLLFNRAFVELRASRPKPAVVSLDDAARVLGGVESMPPDLRGYFEVGHGVAARLRGDLEGADARLRAARSLFEQVDPNHPDLGGVLEEQAALAEARHDDAAVLELARDSIRRHDALRGPGSSDAALARVRIARALHRLGRDDEAAHAAQAALEAFETHGRPLEERATAALALAEARGDVDREAYDVCRRATHAICTEALQGFPEL